MTGRNEITSQAEDTAPTVTCVKHEDSKALQQGRSLVTVVEACGRHIDSDGA